MQSMLVSQQQLMRRKTNELMALPNSSTRNSSLNSNLNENADKSSDEKKKDQESNDELKATNEESKKTEEEISNQTKDLSPILYRRPNSSIVDCSASTSYSNRNKKATSWFNFLPPYKTRSEEFKKHFGHIVPSNERFIVDYSCAYQREILAQGRMYISLNYICFYANIFSWETNLTIKCKDIKQINKTNTALIIPNAIEIVTNNGDKYFFGSYVSREKAYLMLYKLWQNALLDVRLDAKDIIETNKLAIGQDLIWDWIHEAYGDHLGFTEEEVKFEKSIEKAKTELINDTDSSSDSDPYLDSDTFNEMNSNQLLIDSKLTSTENGEHPTSFSCRCKEHEGVQIFNETFPLTVDQMFTLAFDDSPFFRMLQKKRKSVVLSCEQWKDATTDLNANTTVDELKDDETRRTLKKQRELKFKLQIDNALAKSVNVCENQFLDEKSLPGYYYMIYSKCQNSGVPFADAFQVHTQFCFARGSTVKECTLIVHSRVQFVKSGFALNLMKSTIENSSIKGVSDYCKFLSQHLNNWCKEKSLERRQNLSFKQFKQLEYGSSNDLEDDDEMDELDDDDEDFVLSNDNMIDDMPLVKTNSINRKVFDSKRKRFKSPSMSTINSNRLFINKQNTPSFWKFKNNELILFIIFIMLLLILILILFLFKRLWQLEIIIRKYEEDLINFERLIKFTSNLSEDETFKQLFNQSNATVLNLWRDLINQTEGTIRSIKSIYLEKASLGKPFD